MCKKYKKSDFTELGYKRVLCKNITNSTDFMYDYMIGGDYRP